MVNDSADKDPVEANGEYSDADYHDAHLEDVNEWEESSAVVEAKPTGMSVFSLRIPTEEIAALRDAAARQGRTNISELVREAVRAYLNPTGTWAALSIAGHGEAIVWSSTPMWVGGRAYSGEPIEVEMHSPEPVLPF